MKRQLICSQVTLKGSGSLKIFLHFKRVMRPFTHSSKGSVEPQHCSMSIDLNSLVVYPTSTGSLASFCFVVSSVPFRDSARSFESNNCSARTRTSPAVGFKQVRSIFVCIDDALLFLLIFLVFRCKRTSSPLVRTLRCVVKVWDPIEKKRGVQQLAEAHWPRLVARLHKRGE